MTVLVTGGSGSGKSAYAEERAIMLSGQLPRYYIATMRSADQEGKERVAKHRRMRSGKGFCTIEQPVDITKALESMERDGTALVECLTNLTANEMFAGAEPESCEVTVQKIMQDLRKLREGVQHLVIVTGNVHEDGILYDAATEAYSRVLAMLNIRLAKEADEVTEVVAGIPLLWKQRAGGSL